jgi:hypothetical protein
MLLQLQKRSEVRQGRVSRFHRHGRQRPRHRCLAAPPTPPASLPPSQPSLPFSGMSPPGVQRDRHQNPSRRFFQRHRGGKRRSDVADVPLHLWPLRGETPVQNRDCFAELHVPCRCRRFEQLTLRALSSMVVDKEPAGAIHKAVPLRPPSRDFVLVSRWRRELRGRRWSTLQAAWLIVDGAATLIR